MSSASPATEPPPAVLAAFGATQPLQRLAGGRGLTWRSGDIVLRPVDSDQEAEWKSRALSELPVTGGFTVPRPIPASHSGWVQDGWQAMEWVPGAADERRVDDVVDAGAAFHDAVAHLERPAFIGSSDDPWSRADRVAWGEMRAPEDRLIERMLGEYRPVDAPNQLIHGDLLGNVLFAEGHAPAVIDWAPYWRPHGWATAIAVADAVCWHDYPLTRLSEDHGVRQWRQLMLRALVFRMSTLHFNGGWSQAVAARHVHVVEATIALEDPSSAGR
ncbi:MAG TPA: hypothetical protein VN241_15700 [Microbacterium sp.]|nr:hypothetical protein [Microbacterium sp.]